MSHPLEVLSLGGGTQSCALALMSARGDLPRLDAVIFADTRGEMPETYGYLWWLANNLNGIPLIIASRGDLYADMMSPVPTSANPTPPAHTIDNATGKPGKITDYRCSYDYKRVVVTREVKRLCGGRGAWKRSNVNQWIGYSSDEMHRCKQADECRCGHKRVVRKGKKYVQIHNSEGCSRCSCAAFDPWQVNKWPLIDLRMRREDTIRWFHKNGYPEPPRSACTFCPNSTNERWQSLKLTKPEHFEAACVLDETIRTGGGFNARGQSPFCLRVTCTVRVFRCAKRTCERKRKSERTAASGRCSRSTPVPIVNRECASHDLLHPSPLCVLPPPNDSRRTRSLRALLGSTPRG